jgi:hypothetical protein
MTPAPETFHLVPKLIDLFGQAGVLYVAIWFLMKMVKGQYDSRITALETLSAACEKDRKTLHEHIQKMQSERIILLEKFLSKKWFLDKAAEGVEPSADNFS